MRCATAILAMLAVMTPYPGWGQAFDAYALRRSTTDPAFQVEKGRAGHALVAAPDDRRAADRIARLTIAQGSLLEADYTTRTLRYDKAVAEMRDAFGRIRAGGPFPPDVAETQWPKARATTADPLARELFLRVYLDQTQLRYEARIDGPEGDAFAFALAAERAANIRDNTAWLRGVVARITWFDISKYGSDASQGAWLLVQHADHDPAWQTQMLGALEPRVKTGDMQGKYYAYLHDRVAVNNHRPQRYGTQGGCKDGVRFTSPLEDPDHVDARRASVGLTSLAAYNALFTCLKPS